MQKVAKSAKRAEKCKKCESHEIHLNSTKMDKEFKGFGENPDFSPVFPFSLPLKRFTSFLLKKVPCGPEIAY